MYVKIDFLEKHVFTLKVMLTRTESQAEGKPISKEMKGNTK